MGCGSTCGVDREVAAHDEGLPQATYALEADTARAQPTDEVIRILCAHVDAGESDANSAAERFVEALADSERHGEALNLWYYGLTPDGHIAGP